MSITALPTNPDRSQAPSTFVTNANAWVAALSTFTTEANALAAGMNSVAAGGAMAIPYTFSTTTTDSDPGNGILRLDNATQNTATTIRADLLGSDGSTWTSVLDTFGTSTNTIKGYIKLVKASDATKFLIFSVSSVASPSGYRNITVVNVASSGASPFVNSDSLVLQFSRVGDVGATGAAGSVPIAATVGGTVNAITATYSPTLTLSDKQLAMFVSAGANTTTTPTFAPDSLTAHTITSRGGNALVIGDIGPAGYVALMIYNLANTRWELLNPVPRNGWTLLSVVTASTSASVDIDTTFDSTYDEYCIVAENITFDTANISLLSRMKLGGSYISAASSYSYSSFGNDGTTGGVQSGIGSTGATSIAITNAESKTTAGYTAGGKFWLRNPTGTANYKSITFESETVTDLGGNPLHKIRLGSGMCLTNTGALTGVRFLAQTGNLVTGTFRLYGIQKV